MEPLLFFVLTIVLLLAAIIYLDVHPFLALLLAGFLLGLTTGMSPPMVSESILRGFADTLEWIGIVMVLGTVIGEILHETKGALRIAESILKLMGCKRLPVAMALTGYVVAIPVFVDVAYIMLRPVTESLAAASRSRILVVGLSLAAGLTATHALVPPTPGPLAVAGLLEADLGKLLLLNGVVALFAVAGGLIWTVGYTGRVHLPYDDALREKLSGSAPPETTRQRPGLTQLSFASILLPLLLMAVASFAAPWSEKGAVHLLTFLGTPVVALLAGMIVAALLLQRRGRMRTLSTLVDTSLRKSAAVILITGAGGAFGRVIVDAEVAGPIAAEIQQTGIPAVLLPFLLALAFTTAMGSVTISMITTASILLPMLAHLDLSAEMAAAMIGAGALGIIHANSSFFWLLSRLHDVPTGVLYRTYAAQTLCMALGGGMGAYLFYALGAG